MNHGASLPRSHFGERRSVSAAAVALLGAVAGQPSEPAGFVRAVHVLAGVATVLWLLAFAVALRGVAADDGG
ncbi:hypothetical protein M6B22_00380 [Jatrophihabitans cynanchi]|uniref:Uncharacterized protein n=1 Tax=Jatrophihabitans cynanchi TaxID=2944128 RepID=A0ABY7K012_9ACTN|nr:hypothetical protein [Jatrophihabitans sp. SB3-54]WAX57238.1 hypothetical protein M6B22_00380 [Jatrophihabitans sp. SB3-54]